MKVYIGPYGNYVGPYQLANLLRYVGLPAKYRRRLGHWLAASKLNELCEWVESKRQRRVKIRVDKYDTWNADHTLALIILPVLEKLRETKLGSPYVDNEDVPEELRCDLPPEAGNNQWHTKWDWALDEMIWAFQQITQDEPDFPDLKSPEYIQYHERIKRGTSLFGKYFRGLWD